MKLRVMLADDHALFRDALCMLLEMAPDIEVVAVAHDGHSLLQAIDTAKADVVCMDLNMPGLNGIEATRQLLELQPDVKVIGLSASADRARAAEMLRAGALGYVIKGSPGAGLLEAIRLVSRNQNYLDPALGVKDTGELASFTTRTAPDGPPAGPGHY